MVWTLGANKLSESGTCEGSIEASLIEWTVHMWTIWSPYSFTMERM
jgi:hypothetical protein